MKFMKRANIYQASNYNVTFNPETVEAHSYKWWRFVFKVDGIVVFNNYRYSNSTSKHQSKVRSLMSQLGIQIDIHAPFPDGIKWTDSRESIIEQAEENLCNEFLSQELKRQERNERARFKRKAKKLEAYLDQVAFRDYDIIDAKYFGEPHCTLSNIIAVHQVVEDVERDVENALHSFSRDGFGSVVFYV